MLLNPKSPNYQGKELISDDNPINVSRRGINRQAIITFSDGTESYGSCLRCPDTPCIRLTDEELHPRFFNEFPSDTNPSVCPTDAITLNLDIGVPQVDNERCISCGLCVVRCPVDAIFLTSGGAKVNDEETHKFRLTKDPIGDSRSKDIRDRFADVPTTGAIIELGESFLSGIDESIERVKPGVSTSFPGLLTRNLMISLGIPFQTRRLGDTNMRIDAVFGLAGNQLGIAEIQLNETAFLDAPRDILDDCAVLSSRYGFQLDHIVPLIILYSFPNARSEYFRVIEDIYSVLDLKIGSITIGALLLLLWEGKNLDGFDLSRLMVTSDFPTIQYEIEEIIGRSLKVKDENRGFLGPQK